MLISNDSYSCYCGCPSTPLAHPPSQCKLWTIKHLTQHVHLYSVYLCNNSNPFFKHFYLTDPIPPETIPQTFESKQISLMRLVGHCQRLTRDYLSLLSPSVRCWFAAQSPWFPHYQGGAWSKTVSRPLKLGIRGSLLCSKIVRSTSTIRTSLHQRRTSKLVSVLKMTTWLPDFSTFLFSCALFLFSH